VYDRDVLHFTLNGKLHLLTAVNGKTPGAVFIGQGSYELTPASEGERRSLALNSGDDKLTTITDQFENATFLGTALVAAAEKAAAPLAGSADPKAGELWDSYMKKQKKDLHTNMQIRQLQEIVDGDPEPLFMASIDGKKYPPALLAVDPRGAMSDSAGEQTMMLVLSDSKGGFWYSSRYKSELQSGVGVTVKSPIDAENYLIDASIRGAQVQATSTMTFTANSNLRIVPVDLAPRLIISDASFATAADPATWTPVAIIQEKEKEDPDVAVVFPSALKAGEKYLLKITYGGKDVLSDAGDGNFTVSASRRANWYPNADAFDDIANYELHFRTPQKFQIVAVGNEVENRVDGDERIAVWKSTHPLRVAGFNYGRFKKVEQTDKDSGMTIQVYTNPGEPSILRDINQALEYIASQEGGPDRISVNTASLAQAAIADGINTSRTGNMYFGPLADKRVAITQQSQWFFGQSWPGLVYLPYIAFINGTARNTLGLNSAKDFVDSVGAHEMAHQWWGHQVGWHSYRDSWISEGFAEFTAKLVAQQTGGWSKYNDLWEKARRTILEKPRGATISNAEAGPISMGYRLSTWRNPSAYDAIVYEKGAYVLHMLRMAMWDAKAGDQAFIETMREFASAYANKNTSTRDFQHVVEKHTTGGLKLRQDGKLDWFFNQWVYGSEIPRYTSNLNFSDVGGGKYKVTGTITQAEVSDQFAMVVPIYVYFDKTNYVKLGGAMIVGNQSKPVDFEVSLPKKPQKFVVNANHDILSR
nr:hypothetical protein [Acidobacteriota bacterium]